MYEKYNVTTWVSKVYPGPKKRFQWGCEPQETVNLEYYKKPGLWWTTHGSFTEAMHLLTQICQFTSLLTSIVQNPSIRNVVNS